MVRAVAVVLLVFFTVAITTFVAGVAVEPLGEHIKSYDTIDEGELNGTQVINDTYDALFKWSPLIVMGGMTLWGVVWYVRRERVRAGGGGGL